MAAFRAGLDKRGLTDLLELHIKDYPPSSETQGRLMMRDIRLAEAADATRPRRQREQHLADANLILEEVIAANPSDARRFEWRFDLARSLIYEEADPLLTSILYREGGDSDRRLLEAITSRAVGTLSVLLEQLTAEFARIDVLPVAEFERLEASGYIDRVDRLEPRAKYLMLWARFYDALPRDEADPIRIDHLTELADALTPESVIIKTPHSSSRIQVQGLLLAGMTHRRLHDHQRARQNLDRAIRTAQTLSEPQQQPVQWAVTLASIERIRNELEDRRFDEALRHSEVFIHDVAPQSFGLRVVAALLERSVYRRLSLASARDHKPERATSFKESAWQALADLAAAEPEHRDELYATLYTSIDPQADPASLDPLEQCAFIAGLLHDASENTHQTQERLRQAIEVARHFLSHTDWQSRLPGRRTNSLVPEVLYNLAVAHYRSGDEIAATKRFIEVAQYHPSFDQASSAAELAVQIASSLSQRIQNSSRDHREVADLHRQALELLIAQYPDSEAGRYWRFYYAQLLEETGAFDEAADHYARVKSDHERYLDSAFAQVRCLAFALHERSTDDTQDIIAFRRESSDFLATLRNFNTLATETLNQISHPARTEATGQPASPVRAMLAEARVLSAEVHVLSRLPQPAQTLEMLESFETDFPNQRTLAGRVWRVRLIAYERLGQLENAMDAIPAYMAADPARAGPTLQSLYLSLAADADDRFRKGDDAVAQRKGDMALVLAEQVHQWASENDAWDVAGGKRALSLQLAEANLRAGMLPRAKQLFQALDQKSDAAAQVKNSPDLRFELGYAETLFQLGELASALPHFNRLATALSPTDPVRWKSLLRDLQCRTSLAHPPAGIISVIEQQRFFHSELGGPQFAPQFEKLKRENQRRLDGA
ncbi:MAG: hypothetical protein IH989_01110 [Planctomycetes bacterium]|nr:hypothetical protein [Planctomycetota bacterium]